MCNRIQIALARDICRLLAVVRLRTWAPRLRPLTLLAWPRRPLDRHSQRLSVVFAEASVSVASVESCSLAPCPAVSPLIRFGFADNTPRGLLWLWSVAHARSVILGSPTRQRSCRCGAHEFCGDALDDISCCWCEHRARAESGLELFHPPNFLWAFVTEGWNRIQSTILR